MFETFEGMELEQEDESVPVTYALACAKSLEKLRAVVK